MKQAKITLISLLITLTVIIIGCSNNSINTSIIEEGNAAFDSEDWDGVLEKYNSEIENGNDEDPIIFLRTGIAYMVKEDFQKAKERLNKAKEIEMSRNSDNMASCQVYNALAELAMFEDDIVVAKENYELSKSVNPNCPRLGLTLESINSRS